MNGILKTELAPALGKVVEANIIEQYPALFAHSPQVEIHDDPDTMWISSDIPHPYLNCVLRAHFMADVLDERIDAILSHFRSRQLPMSWRIGPSTRPKDLGKRLSTYGLTPAKGTIGMAVDLLTFHADLHLPSGLTIEQVRDTEALRTWVRLVATCFHYPDPVADVLFHIHARPGFGQDLPWRLYLGSLRGEPVAASRLFVAAGVAGIFALSTVPWARRQGIGTAMTLAPLLEARGMGYRFGVLHADRMALGIYRQLGFKEYCQFGAYLCPGGSEQGNGIANVA